MTFFKSLDNGEWYWQREEDILKLTASDAVFAPIGDSFIYKADYATYLKTFVSCQFNHVYNSDDGQDTTFNETHILAYRNCTKCPNSAPFSYGYQEKECRPCSDFSESLLDVYDPYIAFFWEEACGESRGPVHEQSSPEGGAGA